MNGNSYFMRHPDGSTEELVSLKDLRAAIENLPDASGEDLLAAMYDHHGPELIHRDAALALLEPYELPPLDRKE